MWGLNLQDVNLNLFKQFNKICPIFILKGTCTRHEETINIVFCRLLLNSKKTLGFATF